MIRTVAHEIYLHVSIAYAPVTQRIECLPPKEKVVGSTPARRGFYVFVVLS